MRIPHKYELKESNIPNAGKGIFTKENLPKDRRLGIYTGKFLNLDEVKKIQHDLLYTWQLSDNDGNPIGYISADKLSKGGNFLRYINCPRNKEEENCYAVQEGQNIVYYTLRPIKAGDELFVWYGPEYGKELIGKDTLD